MGYILTEYNSISDGICRSHRSVLTTTSEQEVISTDVSKYASIVSQQSAATAF